MAMAVPTPESASKLPTLKSLRALLARRGTSAVAGETYTVTHDREGTPQRAILACLDRDGARHWAETREVDELERLLTEDCCGTPYADGRGSRPAAR